MASEDSCLVRHFRSFYRLDPSDEDLLHSLERTPTAVQKGDALYLERDPAQYFYTIKSGWAYCYRNLSDGKRQVLELLMPGDIVGLRDFAFGKHQTGTVMLKGGTVCPFPLRDLLVVFGASRVLNILFFSTASREHTLLVERLVNLGRRSAPQKLANFIAELYMRLKRVNPNLGSVMPLPVPQEILGDALGLSAVHVSRSFSELRRQGFIQRRKYEIIIPDFRRLSDKGGFIAEQYDNRVHDLIDSALELDRAS